MTALKKSDQIISMEKFIRDYSDTRCEFHEGEVWERMANAPDHSYIQRALGEAIGIHFCKKGGPKVPGGWWIFTEVGMKYEDSSLFSHDLAGWKRSTLPDRPRRYPVTARPDWVCEILSTNSFRDLVVKKRVLHEHQVPYYWIADPVARTINVMEWSEKGYVSILDVIEGFVGKIPPFEAVELKADVLFGEEDE